jgi:hypothetical protein
VIRDSFKAAVFALLVLNTGIYLASGSLSEGLDSLAWLTLLALFQLETGLGKLGRTQFPAGERVAKLCASQFSAVRAIRLIAIAAVGAAAAGFLYDGEWLDAANAGLWIAVVLLLEAGVRRPATVAAHQARFTAAAAVLYAGLIAIVFVWLWRGEWFDAYDAALWLVAFATIEMSVLEAARRAAASRVPSGNPA